MRMRSFRSVGTPKYTSRSNRPGRKSDESNRSGRFVAPNTNTRPCGPLLLPLVPSNSERRDATTRSITPPPLFVPAFPSRRGAKLSISSKNRMAADVGRFVDAAFRADSKTFRIFASLSPT